MVVVLDVLEEGTGDDGEDVTSQYEVSERAREPFSVHPHSSRRCKLEEQLYKMR